MWGMTRHLLLFQLHRPHPHLPLELAHQILSPGPLTVMATANALRERGAQGRSLILVIVLTQVELEDKLAGTSLSHAHLADVTELAEMGIQILCYE